MGSATTALVALCCAPGLLLGACGKDRQAVGDGVVTPDPNNPGTVRGSEDAEVQVTTPGGPAGSQPASTSTTVVTRFRLLATLASQAGPTEGLSSGGGRAVLTLNTEAGEVCLRLNGVTAAGLVTINQAASGAAGPAVVTFPRALDGSPQECADASPDVVSAMNANPAQFQLSVPTSAGPLRGQLVGNAPVQGGAPNQGDAPDQSGPADPGGGSASNP